MNKFDYLKSGKLDQEFVIRLKSVGNIIRMIDDLQTGKHNVHEIHEHKYTDTSYEVKYGYDIEQDIQMAKDYVKKLRAEEK